MRRPFRFGIQVSSLPGDRWVETARRIESLGYSAIHFPDHFGSQWDPVVGQAAVAAVTQRIRVGSLVLGVDYRHPVVMAKQAASLHLVSNGRHEFGIGAGWMATDYEQAGIAFDPPGTRIDRLDEALQIIRSLWEKELTSFRGEHYTITEAPQAVELPNGSRPAILIGGGGRKLLTLAGRHADIVGFNPSMYEGRVTQRTAADLTRERLTEKIEWVREGCAHSARDPADLELSSLTFVVAITDEPRSVRQGIAQMTGLTPEDVVTCPMFLTGSGEEIRDSLQRRREETGISYIVILSQADHVIEQMAEHVVEPLAGT